MLENFIKKYKKLVIEVYLEEDFVKKNKINKKIDSLVESVYNQNQEDEFFAILFEDEEPFVKHHIANLSFVKNYNLYKSLEIFKYIKNNACNLKFCDVEEKNKQWQEFFANISFHELEQRIALYEEISDNLVFESYFKCLNLFYVFYENYMLKKDYLQTLNILTQTIQSCKSEQKINKLFNILVKQTKNAKSKLDIIITCLMMKKFNYKTNEAEKLLMEICENEVSLIMWKLLNEIKNNKF